MRKRCHLPESLLEKLEEVYRQRTMDSRLAKGSGLSAGPLKAFLKHSSTRHDIGPGEILFTENDPGDNMYWIESGAVAILQGDLRDPRLLTFRLPGHVVGEIALIEEIPRTATVAAVVQTELRSLSRDTFRQMLHVVPEAGIDLLRLFSARLREIQPAEYSAGLYDHLTGALSRKAYDDRIQEEIQRARLYRYGFALAFIDLDHFKSINDRYGHPRGDEVLIALTQRFRAHLRGSDLLFRYGGDEFVLILTGTDRHGAPGLVQRAMDSFDVAPIPGNPPVTLSFSVGISHFPDDGETPEALLRIADERAYRAKRAGRGRVVGSD